MTTSSSEQMSAQSLRWPAIDPPIASKKAQQRYVHGETVTDDYYWLNAYFKQGPDADEVLEYLAAENTYTTKMLADTEDLQQQLFAEMKARIKEQDESVPYFKNGYYYYTRTELGQQYYKFCRKKGSLQAPEELLLDIDAMAEGYAYYEVTGFSVSPDNTLLAFGLDTVSRREYTIYIKNLETGEILSDTLSRSTGEAVWANDNQTLFYTAKNPETLLTEKIRRYRLGGGADADVVVYEEKDPSNYIGVEKTKNGRYILIHSESTLSSEVRLLDADTPLAAFQVFQPRQKSVLYSVTALADRFLILTNEGAENFKVMSCPLEHTNKKHWSTFIPHREAILITGLDEFKDYLVVCERQDGLSQLAIHRLNDGSQHYLAFDEATYTVYPETNLDYDTVVLRYAYTSLVTPASIYDYHMERREKTLLKQQEVLGTYQPQDYVSERIYAPAEDGSRIPISLVYNKEVAHQGKAPLLLYGYGSYGVTIDPSFSSARLSLLDRGFVYAIAHIRGGEDMGRAWYNQGKMMQKWNTFNDFIACGHYLIEQQYTASGKLYAQGGSAGGLLMGAVINKAPDLWKGVIAQVPFVDVVNTMLDESIPLTTNEYDEWGNPNEPEAYQYMKSYSPYENVQEMAYPNLLVTTGLHDSQVQYFEPAKWVAKLRALKKGDQVVLLKTDMDYGHGGASGRFDYLKDVALNYAFLLKLEGF